MEEKVIHFKMLKKITKKEMRELDKIWATKVKIRDNYTCQICNKKLEKKHCYAHHIIPRQVRGMRWEINNGITLCFNHHKRGIYSPHQNAIWFYGWLKNNKMKQLKFCIDSLNKNE